MSLPMLQVALDNQTMDSAYETTRLIAEEVDIIEVGTILCVGEGVRAVRDLKALYPHKIVLADAKIADAVSYTHLTHFPPKQKRGGAAVDDYAFARINQLRGRFSDTYFFIVILRLMQIHRRPARALLGNSFCAIAHFFQFAAFVKFIDIASRSGRRNSQTLNDFLNGHKAQLCEHFQEDLMSLCFSHELFRYNLIFLDDI